MFLEYLNKIKLSLKSKGLSRISFLIKFPEQKNSTTKASCLNKPKITPTQFAYSNEILKIFYINHVFIS